MPMPTIQEVVSRYLFNQETPPENIKDESLIRPKNAKGDHIAIEMYEFMTAGGGRFVHVARFAFVLNFLAGNDAAYNTVLKDGTYTTEQLLKDSLNNRVL